MVAANNPSTSQADEVQGVFSDFGEHGSAPRTTSDSVLLYSLRQRHPDYHVTKYLRSCDLRSFAAAGHAACEMVTDNESYDMSLFFEPSAYRLERKTNPGTLQANINFGRWNYTWNGIHFVIYKFMMAGNRGVEQYEYLLAPRSTGTVEDGRHSSSVELLIEAGKWTAQTHEEIFVFDAGQWMKNTELYKSVQSSTWEEVILDPQMKGNLIEDVQGFFDSQSLYKEFQVPWKRGIIFHGLPGNGKTISIKALMAALQAREDPVPSLYVKSFEACQGHQHSIRSIFLQARRSAPCLLIFEDLDSLITDTTRSYFLNEVDGLESNEGILMIGSTNHLDKLDPAIRDRPSRFDRKYQYKLPGEAERTAYAQYWRKKLEKNSRIDFPDEACEFITKMTEGFSFAYLKELFVATLLVVARGGKGDEPLDDPSASVFKSVSSTTEASSDPAPPIPASDLVSESNQTEAEATTATAPPPPAPKEVDEAAEIAFERMQTLLALEIPSSLSDNSVVKVMRQQVRTLLEEMDNNRTVKRERIASASASGNSAASRRFRPIRTARN